MSTDSPPEASVSGTGLHLGAERIADVAEIVARPDVVDTGAPQSGRFAGRVRLQLGLAETTLSPDEADDLAALLAVAADEARSRQTDANARGEA